MCQSITLSSKGNTTISYCGKCQTHYIWQNSYVLSFTPFQYNSFVQDIKKRVGEEEFLIFPDGEERMLLATPLPEMFFTFSNDDWQNFIASLDEAYYMREVYKIIN